MLFSAAFTNGWVPEMMPERRTCADLFQYCDQADTDMLVSRDAMTFSQDNGFVQTFIMDTI